MSATPNPSVITQIGFGFMASCTMFSAIDLGLFTTLGDRALTGEEIRAELGLHPRAIPDFTDALVAMKLLLRDGDGPDGKYRNTPESALFLDKTRPEYIGGIFEMCSARLYGFWGSLTEALKTGLPQNEVKLTGKSVFEAIYASPEQLDRFMNAMTGISMPQFTAFATTFDFSRYSTMCDAGGATGQLSCIVAKHNHHMRCITADLGVVEPIAAKRIAAEGLGDRVTTAAVDFFTEPLPKADVITMARILHDWNLAKKMHLIKAAYDALPAGGAFVALEWFIDDARRTRVPGLLLSLTMLIETGDGFDYTSADFGRWCAEVGFARTETIALPGDLFVAVAYK